MDLINDVKRISEAETMATTESRQSGRGEQVDRNTPINGPINRRIEPHKLRVKRSDNTEGDK